jgi:CRISPR/Cas system CSM-associated protein Csm4 (group 5 of RAMP superfamily)
MQFSDCDTELKKQKIREVQKQIEDSKIIVSSLYFYITKVLGPFYEMQM